MRHVLGDRANAADPGGHSGDPARGTVVDRVERLLRHQLTKRRRWDRRDFGETPAQQQEVANHNHHDAFSNAQPRCSGTNDIALGLSGKKDLQVKLH